jgi:hypothetical protein
MSRGTDGDDEKSHLEIGGSANGYIETLADTR